MSVEDVLALVEAQRVPGARPSTAIPGWYMRQHGDGSWLHFPGPAGRPGPVEDVAVGATPVRDAASAVPLRPSGDLLSRMTVGLPGRLFTDRGV